jgi:hypothetical protein
MKTADDWANEITDRFLAVVPLTVGKAYGGGFGREDVFKALRGPCQQLVDLQAEMVRQRAQLEELMAPGWRPEGQVTGPFLGRFHRFDAKAARFEYRLVPLEGEE